MNAKSLYIEIQRWHDSSDAARAAADLLLERAAATGTLPAQTRVTATAPACTALAELFSTKHLRPLGTGDQMILHLARWEKQTGIARADLLQALARATGKPLTNRRQQRRDRQALLAELLQSAAHGPGLTGAVARRELEATQQQRGRLWSRSGNLPRERLAREVDRYLRLLEHVDQLLAEPDRIVRLVHLSREIAGDSHWLRPGNQVCRDLAEDILAHSDATGAALSTTAGPVRWDQILAEVGIVENMTSIAALLFGRVQLHRDSAIWNWPAEAAEAELPLWLSAAQLESIRLSAAPAIRTIITVENETSFLDLIEQYADLPETLLVYTGGQANRAVIRLLILLNEAFPDAQFLHQGDLDLPGIRILKSLRMRTQLDIQPSHMDADTFHRFLSEGIALSDEEKTAVADAREDATLPCSDLINAMHQAGKRMEQEVITHHSASRLSPCRRS